MSLSGPVLRRVQHELETVDEHGTRGSRLLDDARRLIGRIRHLLDSRIVNAADTDSLELAAHAIQLPLRDSAAVSRKLAVLPLRERCEQASELLVSTLGDAIDESLLDRTARLLHETPQRTPVLDDAKLFADVLNLEDFGVTGLFRHAMQLALAGHGIEQLADSFAKRRDYGYLEVRLKENFHFDVSRQIARRRLDSAAGVVAALLSEFTEDTA